MFEKFHWSKCFLRIHLIGQLLDQSNLITCFYVQHYSLSNGEDRSFLSCAYQKLFKKYPPAFFLKRAIDSNIAN
jgi:hypothetical protein